MSTITSEQERAIREKIASMDNIPRGVGDEDAACSVAAINLALSGELTDRIPECMSAVIGRWIIAAQDAMPSEIRNSAEWRALLPLAAGTGRDLEAERLAVIMEWMWDALKAMRGVADMGGYGDEWQRMLYERTSAASAAAYAAACAASNTANGAYAAASAASRAAADEADAATHAADRAAAHAARAAKAAAEAAAYAASRAGGTDWPTLDPASLLRRLIQIGGKA